MMDKKFDEWEEVVKCNDCDNYWNNQCDGVPKNTDRNCSSFVATRKVVIPDKIKKLEDDMTLVIKCNIIFAVALIIHIVGNIIRLW